jgi:transcription initiation factor TFIIB
VDSFIFLTLFLIDKCPECASTYLVNDYDSGETICGNCGLVVREQMMDMGPDQRAYTQEEKEKRTRVGIPPSYSVHDKGLATAIGRVDRDVYGKKLPLATRLQMWRLRKWQIRSRVHTSVDRNLAQAMNELNRLSEKLYIHDPVKEKAAIIYRKAVDKGLIRGRSIAAVSAATLYAACRFTETPRTLNEIADASLVDKKDVARSYRLLLKELNIHMPVTDPKQYFEKLGLSGSTKGIASRILNAAKEMRITSGKDPTGLAAAAGYIAGVLSGDRKTQKDIAEVAGVTEVTVRNRYKKLVESLYITTFH